MKVPRLPAVLAGLVLAAACGDGPTPPPPPPAAPTVSCPASITLESPNNVPIPVAFAAPTTSGGQAPVTVTCSAQSGATFPLGNTLVSCTATDALQRTATCNFNVAVTASPRISKTKFLAFGDSITAGQCGPNDLRCTSYDERLRLLLAARYSRQTITTINSGRDGESASDDIPPCCGNIAGQDRLPQELGLDFDVLLLMEGTNDLLNATASGVDLAAAALDQMVSRAQAAGKTVFLATIAPMRYPPPAGTTRDRSAAGPFVPLLNDRIRAIATARGARLVDVYTPLLASLATSISSDNLHPTDAGLQIIAQTFYDAIRAALDVTPATGAGAGR